MPGNLQDRSPRRRGRVAFAAVVAVGSAVACLASRAAPRDPLASRDPGALRDPAAPGDPAAPAINRGRGPVPASYIGMHIHHAVDGTPWPSVPFASWRLWDTYAGWPWLEPNRGAWTWDRIDRLIDLAAEHRVEVLLPLGLSPTWASARPDERSAYGHPGYAAEPASLDDWRRYVEAVASRYAGRVQLYEIWNEPNLAEFYSGSVDRMVELCRAARAIIRKIDPAARVVSPAATTIDGVAWLDRFLAAGGADCFDIVGFHLYVWPRAPETIVPLVARIVEVLRAHGIADRPLWNTESGWYVARARPVPGAIDRPEALSEAGAAATVARALVLARAAGIERFFWYSWDSEDMGLADRDGPRPAARALAEVQRWLIGAELEGCRPAAGGAWLCDVVRAGRRRWIAWNPDGRAELPFAGAWRIAAARDLSGGDRAIAGDARAIELGPSPQLLEAAP